MQTYKLSNPGQIIMLNFNFFTCNVRIKIAPTCEDYLIN